MAIVPGAGHPARVVRPAARRGTVAPAPPARRPVPSTGAARPTRDDARARGALSPWHWLWAAVALAVGLFIAAAGWMAWVVGPLVTVAALVSLVTHRRWSHEALWIGLGLTLGVLLHVALAIVRDTAGSGASLLP